MKLGFVGGGSMAGCLIAGLVERLRAAGVELARVGAGALGKQRDHAVQVVPLPSKDRVRLQLVLVRVRLPVVEFPLPAILRGDRLQVALQVEREPRSQGLRLRPRRIQVRLPRDLFADEALRPLQGDLGEIEARAGFVAGALRGVELRLRQIQRRLPASPDWKQLCRCC